MALHCASPTISPPARPRLPPRHDRHSGALPHPAAAPPGALRCLPLVRAGAGAARAGTAVCRVRRRVRYDEDDEDDDEEWGHNEDIARLERYSEGARDQALLVSARVDDEVEVVLVFKVPDTSTATKPYLHMQCRRHTGPMPCVPGFSSSLSGVTAADPARSVLPERAIIQSVDVVKGPFDPNNIEYLEKGVAWDDFKSRLQ
ncbi:hypothetical protein ACP70R_024610 [Stipagrostis hirtigluma subsp. patula]